MKIKLQETKFSPSFVIEIPSSVNVKQLGVGESFTLFIIENSKKIPVEVCFIADRRSLLIQNNVVRIYKLKTLNLYQAQIIRPVEPKKTAENKAIGPLKSPMTGKVISVPVKNEDVVKAGDVLVIIEAMKMENRILAEGEGIVKNIKVTNGSNVTSGDVLLTLTAREN